MLYPTILLLAELKLEQQLHKNKTPVSAVDNKQRLEHFPGAVSITVTSP
jgi:hypothetical protein